MAGHSKWANIQHRKKRQDAKRGKLFTRLIREITVAAREGGGDQDSNPRLRLALDKAFSSNMNKDTIEKAINRGIGKIEGAIYEEITYEGYSSNGVAVLVETVTDNRNRTVAEIRHVFTKFGGNLGSSGSVSYLFKKIGVITFEGIENKDELIDLAIETDIDDYEDDEKDMIFFTSSENFLKSIDVFKKNNYIPSGMEVEMQADTKVKLTDDDNDSFVKFLDALEELDDVQNVYSNLDY
ncbi:MAG: YebC/PmpR family DNA-binding transcriptional regulator [Pseudomonadota bacterium]|jgi:YebC/PmpR family DNA-binding regulatory protein|nr:YebC/PmpR family DNA-binding transcriptional regulator [Pseudomonadota bacterium]|tara:strand:- start:272 stop:988 length:717 start_codon:yes stop_codon:yes gene_type:complete